MRPVTTLLIGLLLLAAMPAAGQSKADPEVMNYTLSMEKLRKLVPAQRALNALYAKDPQFFDKIDRESKAARKQGYSTVADQAAILNRYEGFKRALASAETTPREWLLISEAMGNAFIANEAKKGTLTSDAGPPTAAQKANAGLLQNNDAEFQKIMEELEKLTDEIMAE